MHKTLLKILFTGGAFWLAVRNVAWHELQDAFNRQQAVYVWAAIAAVLLQTICGGLRWHHIRRALGSSGGATHTVVVYYASSFFNNFLPSMIGGDVARIWLAKKSGGHMKDIVYGVIIDRLMSLAGLALLIISTLPMLFPYLGLAPESGIAASLLCVLLAIAGYTVLRMLLPKLGRTRFHLLNDVVAALQSVVDKYFLLLCALLWAATAHVAYATAAYALAQSLGTPIGWPACVVLVPLVLLISSMPISIGGWGLREMGMVGILALAGVAQPAALVLSIQLGLITTFVSLFGGLFYLNFRKQPSGERSSA